MKIVVVCAYYAHHLNTGMLTADLGSESGQSHEYP